MINKINNGDIYNAISNQQAKFDLATNGGKGAYMLLHEGGFISFKWVENIQIPASQDLKQIKEKMIEQYKFFDNPGSNLKKANMYDVKKAIMYDLKGEK